MPGASALSPTWHGYVSDTREALILFEATMSGRLHRVVRRPHDRERSALIQSGSVFIYEESASGIKRWTDGVTWSPSRILGNFLIYRELDKPFPPGEKKRATKKVKRNSRPGEPYPRPDSEDFKGSPPKLAPPSLKTESSTERETERSLVGSLTDSYQFKDGGLVKKTLSVNVENVHYHLVSYYKPEDVTTGALRKPMDVPELRSIQIRHDLLHRQNFRVPIDEMEDTTQSPYSHPRNNSYQPPHTGFPVHAYLPTAGLPPPMQSSYYSHPMSDVAAPPQYYMPQHQSHQGYQSPHQHQHSYSSPQTHHTYADHRIPQQSGYTTSTHAHQAYPEETQAHEGHHEESRHNSYASYHDDRHNSLTGHSYGEIGRGATATSTPPGQYGHYSISPVHQISTTHQPVPVRTSEYPPYPAASYQEHRTIEPPQQYNSHQSMPGWPGN